VNLERLSLPLRRLRMRYIGLFFLVTHRDRQTYRLRDYLCNNACAQLVGWHEGATPHN
jgi:hypothetical protein